MDDTAIQRTKVRAGGRLTVGANALCGRATPTGPGHLWAPRRVRRVEALFFAAVFFYFATRPSRRPADTEAALPDCRTRPGEALLVMSVVAVGSRRVFPQRPLDGDHPEPSPEQVQAWHRRMGPPDNELPGAIPLHAVLATTDDLAVALIGAGAYSTGLSIKIAIRLRRSDASLHGLDAPPYGPGGGTLLAGVAYPDGRSAGNVSHQRFPDPFTEGDAPSLMDHGGGGGRTFEMYYGLTPMPPPGELTVIVAWPTRDIPETRTVIRARSLPRVPQRTSSSGHGSHPRTTNLSCHPNRSCPRAAGSPNTRQTTRPTADPSIRPPQAGLVLTFHLLASVHCA